MKLGKIAESILAVDSLSDESIERIHDKERLYEQAVRSADYLDGRFLADAWCAAFVWEKTSLIDYPITQDIFRQIEQNPTAFYNDKRVIAGEIQRLALQYQFVHWHLNFPDVFRPAPNAEDAHNTVAGWNGGFDVLLGNPPWERVQFEERTFFAAQYPSITAQPNQSKRRAMIEQLQSEAPAIYRSWHEASRRAQGEAQLLRHSPRFPLSAVDKFNTYAVFTELTLQLVQIDRGAAGIIVKAGFVTDKLCAPLFAESLRTKRLAAVFEFENRKKLFPAVDSRESFALLTFNARAEQARFIFDNLSVADLNDTNRHIRMSFEDIVALSPNTKNCPKFSSVRDFDIARKCYSQFGALVQDEPLSNPWGLSIDRYINVSDFSDVTRSISELTGQVQQSFEPSNSYSPLYEGKLFHQYDHRFASYSSSDEQSEVSEVSSKSPRTEIAMRTFIPTEIALRRCPSLRTDVGVLALRDIARRHDDRTLIGCIIPPNITDYTIRVVQGVGSARRQLLLLSIFNSYIFDYLVRQRLGGTHLSNYVLEQSPCLAPTLFTDEQATFVTNRALELSYTSWSLQPFSEKCGHGGAPFRWDEDRRRFLRSELDGFYFHLYGIVRDDVGYIMDTFPITRRKEEQQYGEYRTKRVILEIYDAMAEARRTGAAYQTRLDPPPADPRVAHRTMAEPVALPSLRPTVGQLSQFPAAAWATPDLVAPDHLALFALIDVIRAFNGSAKPSDVRAAAILVHNPAMALAFLNPQQAKAWVRAIGAEARPLPANVVNISQFQKNATDLPWSNAMSQLTGSGALQTGADRWSVASNFPVSSGQDWVAGRAAIAVELISTIIAAEMGNRLTAFLGSVEDGTAIRAVS